MPENFFHRWLERTVEWLSTSGVRIAAVAVATFFFLLLIRRATERLQSALRGSLPTPAKVNRAETLTRVVRDALRMVVWVVGGLMVLSECGLDLKPLLAAAGIGGLAIGFGAQSLVKDVIAGFFLLLEDQVQVGDAVEVAGVSGDVESLSLRTITLRDAHGALHVVPNGSVERVTNFSRDFAYAVVDVPVSLDADLDAASKALADAGAEVAADPAWAPSLRGPFEVVGYDRFTDGGVSLRARAKTEPGRQGPVAREALRRAKRLFDERRIPFASARRPLSLVADAPLRVAVEPRG